AVRRSPWPRRCVLVGSAVAGAAVVSCGVVWWQLGSGPISVDVMTPWLTSALEERLGGQHRIEVGGTMLERDEVGHSALRLRDIVVRDAQGTVVASAPKAEVGIAGLGLLSGRVQTDRMSLIGAEMALRIEPNGSVNIFTGAGKNIDAAVRLDPQRHLGADQAHAIGLHPAGEQAEARNADFGFRGARHHGALRVAHHDV